MDFLKCWNEHRRLYITILILTAITGLFWVPSLLTQLVILLAGVLVIGIAHGAIDYRLGRELLEPTAGHFWLLLFTGFYLILGFAMFGIWIWSARAGLAIFLILAIPHFGFEDILSNRYSTSTGYVLGLSIGVLPIVLPCFFDPEQTTRVFNFLLPDLKHIETASVFTISQYLLPISFVCIFFFGLRDKLSGEITWSEVGLLFLETGTLTLMFSVTKPILAFTVYYCAGHSSREMLEIMEESYSGPLSNRLRQFLLEALPIALTTVLIGIAGGYLLGQIHLKIAPILALTVFVGLSIVLIPHMVFDILHDKQN